MSSIYYRDKFYKFSSDARATAQHHHKKLCHKKDMRRLRKFSSFALLLLPRVKSSSRFIKTACYAVREIKMFFTVMLHTCRRSHHHYGGSGACFIYITHFFLIGHIQQYTLKDYLYLYTRMHSPWDWFKYLISKNKMRIQKKYMIHCL